MMGTVQVREDLGKGGYGPGSLGRDSSQWIQPLNAASGLEGQDGSAADGLGGQWASAKPPQALNQAEGGKWLRARGERR